MQEEITQRSVALTTRTARLTAEELKKLLSSALRQMKQHRQNPHHGKQTVRQLARQNAGLQTIEISGDNIKSFGRVARKYGVDFALRRDDSASPPLWVVLFKSRDADALTAAFKEYTAKSMKRGQEKPSVLNALHQAKQRVAGKADPTRNKQKELAI